eukprot:TRINITY_DN735_c0_g1_i1.p2 TRINITY_DN735_c0_g1~~TRINITY_DN735_c0_g1_i1.p2  ORF type:complete len:732 (+),score=345.75 TRINITY_DN735_c0_g1_i1:60-2255(+)
MTDEAAMGGDDPPSAADGARARASSTLQESGGGGGDKDEKDEGRIMVYARKRPTFKRDLEDPAFEDIVNMEIDGKSIRLTGGKTYQYDGTFGANSQQYPVWLAVGKPLVDNVFKGYCGTCIVYGQTGTGKSHTMSNINKGEEGIIPQSMIYMFSRQEEDQDRTYDLLFSFLQIYRDKVSDLMKPESDNLDIVRNDEGEVSIPGITSHECNTKEKFIELYEEGDQHRIVAATKMNPVSSRGHSCMMISIKSKPKGDGGDTRSAKMWMIDLAGYERFSKTGVLEGIRKEEAKCINASLLSLGNVISALSEKQKHVPWRNSKLTRLLQDAIGGKAKATVMLTLGPSAASFHETVGTLYFGSRAMACKTEAKLQLSTDYASLCKKLEEMLTEQRERYTALEIQATNRQIEAQQREDRMKRQMAELKKRHDEQLKGLMSSGASKEAIEAMMKENQEELELVEEQQQEEIKMAEEKNDEEVQEIVKEQVKMSSAELDHLREDHEKETAELKAELAAMKEENERLQAKEKEATELQDAITKMKEEHAQELMKEKETAALSTGVSKEGMEQLKGEYDKQVQSIRQMLESTHEARMLELEQTQDRQVKKLQQQLEDSQSAATKEYEDMKASLIKKYEEQAEKERAKAKDIQEKLKRNHLIIKNSYQDQKQKLQQEIEDLKQGHSGDIAGADAASREQLAKLTEQHQTIKRNYQDQFDKQKKEIEQLREALKAGGHVDPTA